MNPHVFNKYGVPLMNPHVSNQCSVPLTDSRVSNQLNSGVIIKLRETVNPNGSEHGDESEAANQVPKVSMTIIYIVFLANGSVSYTPPAK